MKTAFDDPLLLIGKIAAIFMQGVMAIGGIALLAGLAIIPFLQDMITAEMRTEFADPTIIFPLFPVLGLVALGFLSVAMLFVFFDRLRRIIGTVGEGDPFVAQNARRLSLMGWLMLGVQLLAIPFAGLAPYLSEIADKVDNADLTIEAGFDLSGILLVILLFILARVFRHGAAMRDDLEGTI